MNRWSRPNIENSQNQVKRTETTRLAGFGKFYSADIGIPRPNDVINHLFKSNSIFARSEVKYRSCVHEASQLQSVVDEQAPIIELHLIGVCLTAVCLHITQY